MRLYKVKTDYARLLNTVSSPRSLKGNSSPFYVSRVELALSAHNIKIKNHQVQNGLFGLSDDCPPVLELEPLIKDRSFLLWDQTHKILLHSWTDRADRATPMVLGNPDIDPIELAGQRGEDRIHKDCTPENNPTPYYYVGVISGQYEHVYIQPDPDRHSLLLMTTRLQREKQIIEKQNRVCRIATYDINGSPIPPEEQRITYAYLATFTREVLRNGEVSKSSLLGKIARIYLEN